jgi:hypothetical protein
MTEYLIEDSNGQLFRVSEVQDSLDAGAETLADAVVNLTPVEINEELTVESVSAITESLVVGDEYVLPATVLVTVEGEEEAVEMEVEWDAEVDTTEAGEFTFTGTLVLPEGYVNTNEVVVEATITVVSAEDAALEAAETAVVAYEEVDVEAITEYAQVEGIEALEAAAVEAVEAVTDEEAKAELEGRIDDKKADVDEALAVFVDAVDAATNQLDLFDALDAFWTVDVDYLVEYWTLVDNGADISDVHAIQENVVEAVTDTLAEQEVVDAIVAAVEAENQLTLKTALETYADNFERLNFASAHIAEYMDEFDTAYTADPTDLDTIEEIQDLIDDANLTLADAAVTTAVADVDQAKWDTANTLVQALKDDVDPDTDKQDLVDALTDHQLIINVVNAKVAGLEAAITALEDHEDAGDFTAEVYVVLLADYVAAIGEADAADKNTVAELNTIVDTVNGDALEATLDVIFAVTAADTEESDFLVMLNDLVAISDFDMTLVNQDWLADYIAGIEAAELTTADEGVTELEGEFTTVNNAKASDAKEALDDEVDAATVLQALKDLLLTGIVDANADFYFAEVEYLNSLAGGEVDFSAADVADIQADVVNTGNLVADVMNAENGTAMRTALAPFGVENADYVELSSAVKLEVAELILADIALDADANGDYTNADTLVTTLGDVVTEMDGFLAEINPADMDTIAEMLALLNNDDARDYVVFADFEELGVADQMTVAEAVLNAIPEDGFATISAVRDAIANAIAGL